MTDFRALCEELVEELASETSLYPGHERGSVTRAHAALAEQPVSFAGGEEVIRLDKDGFHYRDQFIDDAGEAHRLMVGFLRQGTAPALAEQPVGPTDEELWAVGDENFRANYYPTEAIRFARAVLARWGSHPTPIPVAERLPEFSDCDPHERVWVWNPFLDHWKLSRIKLSVHTHWLPANALPAPEAP
jgi:hypothetical protein